jgi:hypothetical protein
MKLAGVSNFCGSSKAAVAWWGQQWWLWQKRKQQRQLGRGCLCCGGNEDSNSNSNGSGQWDRQQSTINNQLKAAVATAIDTMMMKVTTMTTKTS